MTHVHMEPQTIPLMKEKYDGKSDKYFVKLEFHRDPTPTSMSLGCFCVTMAIRESFCCSYVRNLNMTLVVSGTLEMGKNIQYLCTIVRVEALHKFDSLSANLESTETLNVEYIIKGLRLYFPPIKSLSTKKCVMRRGMKKLRGLKLRCYAELFIDNNIYLA